MKIDTTVLTLILMGILCVDGIAQRVMDQRLRRNYVPFGLIQKDSLAILPKIVHPDTVKLQKPCIRFHMRYFKPKQKFTDGMPRVKSDEDIHFNMPIAKPDTSCWKIKKTKNTLDKKRDVTYR